MLHLYTAYFVYSIYTLPYILCSIYTLPYILCSIYTLPYILCSIYTLPYILCSIYTLLYILCSIYTLPFILCSIYSLPYILCSIYALPYILGICFIFSQSHSSPLKHILLKSILLIILILKHLSYQGSSDLYFVGSLSLSLVRLSIFKTLFVSFLVFLVFFFTFSMSFKSCPPLIICLIISHIYSRICILYVPINLFLFLTLHSRVSIHNKHSSSSSSLSLHPFFLLSFSLVLLISSYMFTSISVFFTFVLSPSSTCWSSSTASSCTCTVSLSLPTCTSPPSSSSLSSEYFLPFIVYPRLHSHYPLNFRSHFQHQAYPQANARLHPLRHLHPPSSPSSSTSYSIVTLIFISLPSSISLSVIIFIISSPSSPT